MCGIAGFIGFRNNIEHAENANKIQQHRGPDNQSVWNDDYIALAHQRLAIIDLSDRSNQPFIKGNFVIVFNGEIYNYKDLRIFFLQGIKFSTSSDTEVVLDMYIKFGEKSLDYFIGMFSFAIYNRTSQELFAARDHFGIKPFFYTQTKIGFGFASELKTLTQLPDFNKQINFKALISSLNYLWVSGNETMFKDCFKLPPAHYLRLKRKNQLSVIKYWTLKENILQLNENEHVQKLKTVLEKSIEHHMTADVPVSAFLSGGLDSSFISVIAQEYNKDISTYTIATEQKDKLIESMPEDEKYAKMLSSQFNFNHNEIVINATIVDALPAMVRILDEPIGDPAALNTFLICEAARNNGVKVLLSGMGADEIFFGYRRMKATLIAQGYKRLPNLVRGIIEFIIDILPVRLFNKGLYLSRWAKKFKSFANLPIEEAYRMSYSYYNKEELKTILNYKHNNCIEEIYTEHSNVFNSKYKGDLINQMCNTDINMFMVGLNLTYTDRASMAASVEVRVPFIDKNVIEAVMGIPGGYKYKNKESKYILKKVAEYFLPIEIIYRKKSSFGAPIRSWISNDLKTMVDELLSIENITKRGIFNPEYIKILIEKDRNGIEDNAYRIYQLLTLELWFKEFID